MISALGLTACGSGDSDDGEKVLRVAPSVAPVSLDPHGEQSAEEGVQTIVQHLLDPLVRVEDGEYVPMLATEWKNPDPKTWVFTIRDKVKFHDGSDLTAKDVKASVDRLIKLEGPLSPLWAPVDSVEATDDHTVTIKTKQPQGTMLSAASLLFVGPADKIDQDGFWRHPVGTGPFKFEEFLPDEKVTMKKNADYWGGAPKLDKLEFTYIPEIAARLTALENGEVDVTTSVPPDQAKQVKDNGDLTMVSGASYTYYFNWFNASRKPFDNPKVRQAMWHAVNVEGAVQDLFGDQASVAQGPIPQDVFGATKLQPYKYDPTEAKRLLAEAGYPDGFKTTLQFPRESGPNIRALAQAFISDWKAVGVTVTPQEKERAQWIEDLNGLKWDMNLQTNSVGTGDADYTLGRLYPCKAKRNGYCNPELDNLLDQARSSLDPKERTDLYAQASQIIWDDAVGIFPMDLANNAAFRKEVKGFKLLPNGRARFHTVDIEKD